MLVDLRQKVAMYERELNLVNEQSSKIIKELEDENSKLKEKANDAELNGNIAQEIDKSNANKTRKILEATKGDLEGASNAIKALNEELRVQ